jgi:succinate dehydrogenase/fumarate reductase flavoprotein subunit
MGDSASTVAPGAVNNGAALARPLEFAAREKGVRFIVNMHMDEIIREQQFSGRVIGVKASYSPRFDPSTGRRLESYFQNGNIDDRRETIYIKAKKGVVVASGGHGNNPQYRSMFFPGWKDPAFTSSAWALLGPRGQDASGIIASLKVGANLAGMQQNLSYGSTYHFPGTLATRDSYTDMLPGHPTFPFRGSTGLTVADDEFEHLIVVNQVGKRFYNELTVTDKAGGAAFPADPSKGQPNKGLDHKQLDWRNATAENVRKTYRETNGIYAAMAPNEASVAPDYLPGPIWAIFDAAAVERTGWKVRPPFISTTNGYFFQADTIEELAGKIRAGHEFQRVALKYLKETVDKWNAAAKNGGDEQFARGPDAPMWPVSKPPFYAASLNPVWHDSYGGLRVNSKTQVLDFQGQAIPGLYAAGEAVGAHNQHGLGKGLVLGYIAGSNVAVEKV